MSGGRKSRDKGNRFEREVVRLFNEDGIPAERIPLSGSAGGSFTGDLKAPMGGRDWRIEAKARKAGFVEINRWLEGNDALVLKADRKVALVCLRLRDALEIVRLAEMAKATVRAGGSGTPAKHESET